MKPPFNARAPAFDAQAIQQTIQRALASAGLDTTQGPMRDVSDILRRALATGGAASGGPAFGPGPVVDVEARVVADAEHGRAIPPHRPPAEPLHRPGADPLNPPPQAPGRFEAHSFSSAAGSRAYKVYVPAARPAGPRAMVVMLHGCTQSADDFAAGTQMNRLAEAQGFLVVYPEQSAQANNARCWNWFRPQDQARDTGEPAIIAGIVRQVADRHGADPRRIFVAGLSAGAAMAVVLGETHPDLFAAVGVHSGLPYGSAHDIPSAMAAMKGGRSGLPGLQRPPLGAAGTAKTAVQPVPVIVFHGDRDHTVQAVNADHIVVQALQAHAGRGLRATTEAGVAPGGRRFSRTVHTDADGQARIECWTLHGGGHAWSGGHAGGSYTDGAGPDASGEMVRFFLGVAGDGAADGGAG